jgi:hemerythrin superfamily protein
MSGSHILSSDHSDVDELFTVAFAALDRGEDAFAAIDLLWARLAVHIRAEHLHLFPALSTIAERISDTTAMPTTLARLRDDHDHFMKTFASVVKDLRQGEVSDVRRRLTDVAARLAEHNDIEEKEVYPLVEKWLNEKDRQDLYRGIVSELEHAPPRFPETMWRTSR